VAVSRIGQILKKDDGCTSAGEGCEGWQGEQYVGRSPVDPIGRGMSGAARDGDDHDDASDEPHCHRLGEPFLGDDQSVVMRSVVVTLDDPSCRQD
jgi:hypothetical protein